jgi:hypothetical protein
MLKIYKLWTGLILASVLLIGSGTVLAWDNKTTHKDLSDAAAGRSILNSGYLQNTLGIGSGLDATLHWSGGTGGTDKKIRLWIQDGADFEDNCIFIVINCRFYNHFHNPLQPWPLTGLNDVVSFGGITTPVYGESVLLWAQNDGTIDQSNTDWSWQATRQHYYLGLTSQLNTNRDAELTQTFVGLGHQIHLLQDMSQPSHVRNDAHPEDYIGSWLTVLPFHWLEAGRWKVWNI